MGASKGFSGFLPRGSRRVGLFGCLGFCNGGFNSFVQWMMRVCKEVLCLAGFLSRSYIISATIVEEA